MQSRSRRWALLGVLALLAPTGASAQAGPIVVVVESGDPAVRPAAFRRELAEALGVPVRALGATDAERSIVMVQVLEGEPARVRIQRPGVAPRRTTIPRGSGPWLLEGVIEAMRGASLVTWEGDARRPAGPRLAEWEEPEPTVESGEALDPPPR